MSLFPEEPRDPPPPGADAPLADRMRPRRIEEVVGQDEVLGEGSPIRLAVEEKALQVDGRPQSRPGVGEGVGEPQRIVPQAVEDRRVEFGCVGLHGKLDS